MRYVQFRAGGFLARLFLAIEPVIGLERAQRVLIFLMTHKPFYRRDVQ